MAIDKKKLPPPREMPMDAAVESAMTSDPNDPIYGNIERRRKVRNLTEYQRRKMERDAQRVKVTVEMSLALKQRFVAAYDDAKVPPSDLVGLLLYLGMDAIESRQINLDDYRYTSNLPRYQYRLVWDKDSDEE